MQVGIELKSYMRIVKNVKCINTLTLELNAKYLV